MGLAGTICRRRDSRARCFQSGAPPSSPKEQVKNENFMKILATIARYLLALIFIVFGLNGLVTVLSSADPVRVFQSFASFALFSAQPSR
jgi:cytochrome b561